MPYVKSIDFAFSNVQGGGGGGTFRGNFFLPFCRPQGTSYTTPLMNENHFILQQIKLREATKKKFFNDRVVKEKIFFFYFFSDGYKAQRGRGLRS